MSCYNRDYEYDYPCCYQPPKCCYPIPPVDGGLNAYGGILYQGEAGVPFTFGGNVPVPFNGTMSAGSNVISGPINNLTIQIPGDYEIYYYFSMIDLTGTGIDFSVTLNGQVLPSTTQRTSPGRNFISGTLMTFLNAGDIVGANMFSMNPAAQVTLLTSILTVKKLNR